MEGRRLRALRQPITADPALHSRASVLTSALLPLQPDLLEILRCPKCHGRVSESAKGLQCDKCRLLYPVVDGIPNFLLDEALPLEGAAEATSK